jgi:hypothetical protein
MNNTKNPATPASTDAQLDRVALIRKEIADQPSRITTRRLTGGFLRVTEYAYGEKHSRIIHPDGQFVAE